MNIKLWLASDQDHHQASLATRLKEALLARDHDLQIDIEDVFERYYHALGGAAIQASASALQEWLPGLWGQLYEQSTEEAGLDDLFSAIDLDATKEALQQDRPALVLAFHPLAALPLLRHKQAHPGDQLDCPLVMLQARYHIHPSALSLGVSRYIVPHPSLGEQLLALGVSPEKVQVCQPPLHSAFAQASSRRERREALQLQPSDTAGPVVLVRATALPPEDLTSFFFQLALLDAPVQWMFDFGDDQALAEALRKAASLTGVEALMFGGQPHLQPFCAAADLILATATPILVAEALATRTPLLLWPPQPGAEAQDAEALSRLGVALTLPPVAQMGIRLGQVLASKTYTRLQEQVEDFREAQSDQDLATYCLSLIANKEAILTQDRATHSQEAAKLRPEALSTSRSSSKKQSTPGFDVESWKEAYTEVLLKEKRLQKKLADLDEQLDQWDLRLEQAEKRNDATATKAAEAQCEALETQRKDTQQQWQRVQDDKQTLLEQKAARSFKPTKESATETKHTPQPSSVGQARTPKAPSPAPMSAATKARFQAADMDDELARLKQKMRLDKGKVDLSKLKDEE